MLRHFILIGTALAMSACAPTIPESGAGFDNDLTRVRSQNAGMPSIAGAAGPVTGVTTSAAPRVDAFAAAEARGDTTRIVNASPGNAAPELVNNPGISTEQDFGTVSANRSIESDAARIEANRQQYAVVQPTALPQAGEREPNIIAYALQTTNLRGQPLYQRSVLTRFGRAGRGCGAFASADEAQIEFLREGGPQKDRKGLDPDGDGFACDWDPVPYRRIKG